MYLIVEKKKNSFDHQLQVTRSFMLSGDIAQMAERILCKV